jgi:hypothetical protein
VSAPVFDRFRVPLYRQAGYKPYVIAAMIVAARIENLQEALSRVMQGAERRIGRQ